jgi:hypothetical protein
VRGNRAGTDLRRWAAFTLGYQSRANGVLQALLTDRRKLANNHRLFKRGDSKPFSGGSLG